VNTKTKSNDAKQHTKRKNPAAHAAWMARKKALNAARYAGGWTRPDTKIILLDGKEVEVS
jgi:hypothetical protein